MELLNLEGCTDLKALLLRILLTSDVEESKCEWQPETAVRISRISWLTARIGLLWARGGS